MNLCSLHFKICCNWCLRYGGTQATGVPSHPYFAKFNNQDGSGGGDYLGGREDGNGRPNK